MPNRAIQARILVAFVAVGALCPTSLHAQEAPITNGDSVLGWPISIRLVNGKNGKPITDENLNVFINNATDSQLFRPDERGIITKLDRDDQRRAIVRLKHSSLLPSLR